MSIIFRIALSLIAALSVTFGGARAQAFNALADVVPPIAAGRYPVGCSNVEQDFSRAGGDPTAYWEGRGGGGSGYVTDLLVDPAHAFVVNVTLPDDSELYGDFHNRALAFGTLVCYPTSATSTRSDYPLPTGRVVPRMQRGGEPPIFAGDRARFPVLLFSHGLGGSPLSSDYIDALALFASHGYVVIAPFHGDARIADVRVDTISDVFNAILHFSAYTAMQAIRPHALKAALDAVLADPDFAARTDVSRIGGFGGSLGGESLLLMRGAQLTVSPGLSSKSIMNDTRLKAAVGYVPYFGQPLLPAFGRDEHGLDNVAMPYLAIAGSADTTAPAVVTALGMTRLSGVRQFVLLAGVRHGFDVESSPDIFTWSLAFLNAYVDDDRLARATSARMTSVAGGGDDVLLLDRAQPLPPAAGEWRVIEYYSASLDRYRATGDPGEVALLDAGIAMPGWRRTGFSFKVYAVWAFEDPPLRPAIPDVGMLCPADRVPLARIYNNGKGGQGNRRYLTSHSELAAMLVAGWSIEGPVYCSLP